jgi:VWFA-related protein
MKRFTFIIFLLFLLSISAFAQNPTPTPVEDDNVVKITTSLIQIDVTVTDKDGKQITDLKPEEIEIFENGKLQEITNFSYMGGTTPSVKTEVQNQNSAKQIKIPPVPLKLRPEQVRRTIVLVVDDLTLTFASMFSTRDALKKFVNEQMLPTDLVAIIQTSTGISSLQQFTSDKRILLKAIEKISWKPAFTSIGVFEPIKPTTKDLLNGMVDSQGQSRSTQGNEQDKENEARANETRKNIFVAGSLGAIRYVVRGMTELPGRKTIMLFSDGFRIFPVNRKEMNADTSAVRKAMDDVIDEATRAGVIINTVDARGLDVVGMFTAEDDTLGKSLEDLDAIQRERIEDFAATQTGLAYLADKTGGQFHKNMNNLAKAVRKSLDDQNGYYLVGYQPSEETFDASKRKFNKLEVRVKRPDVKVRYRSGFFNVTDESLRPANQTTGQKMLAALFSPFGASGITMRLTSIFANDTKEGNFIRALMHLDTKDIKFTDEPNGNKKAQIELVAYTIGDTGNVVDSFAKTYTFNIKESEYKRVMEKGLIYSMVVPVKKSGAYQLRIVVRDNQNGNIGAANQFIEVPNLSKDRMALSGIILQNLTQQQWKERLAETAQNSAAKNDKAAIADAQTVTATRAFRRGTILFYNYVIYNPKVISNQVKLEAQARLYRDGQIVFEGSLVGVNTSGQTDLKRIAGEGAVQLGANLTPGDYVLQVVVYDSNAKEKNQVQAQWIDFEIVD